MLSARRSYRSSSVITNQSETRFVTSESTREPEPERDGEHERQRRATCSHERSAVMTPLYNTLKRPRYGPAVRPGNEKEERPCRNPHASLVASLCSCRPGRGRTGSNPNAHRVLRRQSFRCSAAREQNCGPGRFGGDCDPHVRELGHHRATNRQCLERKRSELPPQRSRRARCQCRAQSHAGDDRHHWDAEVGERRDVVESSAAEDVRPDDVLADACHSVQRSLGARHRGLYSVWNEPNLQLFLTPQFSSVKTVTTIKKVKGKKVKVKKKTFKIVGPANYAKLFKAAYAGIKSGNPPRKLRWGDICPRPRQADQRHSDTSLRPHSPSTSPR